MKNAVRYSAFGAKGDGKNNDIAAIIAAHEYANEHNLPVRADAGAVYYIGDADRGAIIRTDTDWTDSSFIIDDTAIDDSEKKRGVSIFSVRPSAATYSLAGKISSLRRGQENLGVTFPVTSIVTVTDDSVRHYIRKGRNANSGSAKTDIVVAAPDGSVDPAAPIIWDFDRISAVNVTPMDTETLTLRGGTFTTIANNYPSRSAYYSRGITVFRSNTVVENLTHLITGEGEDGLPYAGIVVVRDSANVTIRNCTFTAHKTYYNNAKGLGRVGQGTYEISLGRSVNVTLDGVRQTNDICDSRYWGLMGSNFCKNIVVRGCVISRFDAHQGVANVTITDSTLGYQCLNAIGTGTILVENTTLYGRALINLREDYGSTWEGEAVIRNCRWIPNLGNPLTGVYAMVSGRNSETHDFGYPCCMPHTVTVDGLIIDDSKAEEGGGICFFGNPNPDRTDEAAERAMPYPYAVTENLRVRNLTTVSGREVALSKNPFMFRNLRVSGIE